MSTTLTEHQAKRFLADHGIPVTRERLAADLPRALAAAAELGYPVAMKASGPDLAHKTERGLVRLGLRRPQDIEEAWRGLAQGLGREPTEVLVQEMIADPREFVAGLVRDPQFGPTVMFGLGGIYTEALRDVAFRVAPLSLRDALDMQAEIRGRALLEAQRGGPAADCRALAEILVALGRLGLERPRLKEIDINPLKLSDGRPLAVDALVVLADQA